MTGSMKEKTSKNVQPRGALEFPSMERATFHRTSSKIEVQQYHII
jgi:hypothetical protein